MPTYLLNLRAVYIPFHVFKIILQVDDDNLTIPMSVDGKQHVFTLRKLTADEIAEGRVNPNPRAEGKLYTLYNCTTGALYAIPNKHFDTAVSAYGRLTRPCL